MGCPALPSGGDSLGNASGSCPAVVRTARETAKWPRFEGIEWRWALEPIETPLTVAIVDSIRSKRPCRLPRRSCRSIRLAQPCLPGRERISQPVDGMTGYIPAALVALAIIDAERLCERLNVKLGLWRESWTALAAKSMRAEECEADGTTKH